MAKRAFILKRVSIFLGWMVLLLALSYVGVELNRHFESLPAPELTIRSMLAVVLAILAYSAAMLSWGVGWGFLLRGLGETTGLLLAFSIIGVSQITKYVPGNVVHHIGRVALAKRDGLSTTRVLSSMLLELAWLFAASASCGVLALAMGGGDALLKQISLDGSVTAFFVAGAIGTPVCLVWLLHIQRPRFFFDRFPDGYLVQPGITTFAANFAFQILSFLLHGAAIAVLATGLLNLDTANYWLSVGVFSLSWLVGFIAPGAPAGLGIRDAVMIAGLSLAYSMGDAIVLAAFHRVVSIAGDIVVFVSALLIRRFSDVVRSDG
jgi:glycosyltransferase 2 family protein